MQQGSLAVIKNAAGPRYSFCSFHVLKQYKVCKPHQSTQTEPSLPKPVNSPMPFCADGRFHAPPAEAAACTHHPADKDFRTVNQVHPKLSKSKKRTAPKQNAIDEEEDTNNELPIAPSPFTPAPASKTGSVSKSPSPLARKPGYLTPPFSQEIEEDIGDNIVVAMSSGSQIRPSSPAAAVPRQSPRSSPPVCDTQRPASERNTSPVANDEQAEEEKDELDNIPGPLSSSPPPQPQSQAPTRSPSAAPAPTTRVPETEIADNTTLVNKSSSSSAAPNLNNLENDILTLRADRARLTDALSSSTFQVRNLHTRTKLQTIENQLARTEAAAARARAKKAWEVVDMAREGRKNAWTLVKIVVGMVVCYGVWCWWNSVEMVYLRRRRCWVYGLEGGC